MISSVRVGEAVQGVLLVDAERIAGDEHRARCAQGDIALTAAHRAAADSRSGVIARARADEHVRRQAQRLGGFSSQRADGLPALKQLRQLDSCTPQMSSISLLQHLCSTSNSSMPDASE